MPPATRALPDILLSDRRCVFALVVRFPTESNPRPVKGMEIASLALTGLPRPHPFAMERGAEALEVRRWGFRPGHSYVWAPLGAANASLCLSPRVS